MTDTTANLELPFILPAQAQKHVTHNEALQRLDALVQLVITSSAATPPTAPEDGEVHWVTAPASGLWAGRSGQLALFQDGIWLFILPKAGWAGVFLEDSRLKLFDGADWIEQPLPLDGQFNRLGIAATPDGYNRLSLSSPASLSTMRGTATAWRSTKRGPRTLPAWSSSRTGRAEPKWGWQAKTVSRSRSTEISPAGARP